ncbi:MAG: terminase family protein [Motiliproteus sp.]
MKERFRAVFGGYTAAMPYSQETIDAARKLFMRRYKVNEIHQELSVPKRTLYHWASTHGWLDQLQEEETSSALNRRLVMLAEREGKTDLELQEMTNTVGLLERLDKLEERKANRAPRGTTDRDTHQASNNTRQADDDNPKKKTRRRKRNNDFTGIDEQTILERFKSGLYPHQLQLWEHRLQRIREILKSRQIGLTYYFAKEAFTDALLTGEDQIFISASRAQVDVFREYIKGFALDLYDIELKGKDKVQIHCDAGSPTFRFLSTNSTTAQSYNGNVYIDEYFWIPKFDKLNTVAAAMATHKHLRKTYFSTPSAMSHSAYNFWSMKEFNTNRRAANEPDINLPDKRSLKRGTICGDGHWRKVIDIHDAVATGFDRVDIDQLKLENGPDKFAQLFECQFIDDTASVFKLAMLEKCLVDRHDWRDFKPDAARPFGNQPVWIGYDPSRTRDGACIVVVAPPLKPGGKFRVLEKITLHNCAWQFQAQTIKELTKKYSVDYIGIDVTGPGSGVFEQVQKFFPAATAIHYSPQTKTRLVLKAQQIVLDKRVAWDASWSDIAAGFMQIRQTTSGSGQIIYVADRSDLTGHADAAWAISHALINEGLLTPDDDAPRSKVVWSDAA